MISRTTPSFWACFRALPLRTQQAAIEAYQLWRANPAHPGLRFKRISDRHATYAIRVGIHWRVLGYRERLEDEEVMTWFWIGSHAEYDRLVAAL